VPTDPTTPDTERSIDGAAYADCTEEETTISGTATGSGYITFTGDEMNASLVMVAAKAASGPNTTLATLYPRVLAVLFSGTASAGAAGSITLVSPAPAITDLLIGCIVRTTGGTGGGGGSGSLNNQARVITAYTSGRVATVVPNWETTPDGTTTYQVLLTEAALIRYADVKLWAATETASTDIAIKDTLAKTTDITGFNDLSAAQVNAEVDTAIADVNLDHLVGTATGIPAIPAGTYVDQMMDNGTETYDRTTDSLQAIRDRGDAAWTSGGTDPWAGGAHGWRTTAACREWSQAAGIAQSRWRVRRPRRRRPRGWPSRLPASQAPRESAKTLSRSP